MILTVAVLVLTASAFMDGLSTVHFLKSPKWHETNPLFGPRPSTLRIFGEGTGLIGAEIAFAFLMKHYIPASENYVALIGFAQAGYHIVCAVKNYKLPV